MSHKVRFDAHSPCRARRYTLLLLRGAAAAATTIVPVGMAGAVQSPVNVAAPALTLREASERALSLLPEVAAGQRLRDQVEAERRASRGPFVGPPVVSGDVVLGSGGLTEQEIGVSAGFRWPGEGRAARTAADRGGELVEADLQEARLRIAGQLRAAWWKLASAMEVIAVERKLAEIADQEVATVTRLVGAGVQARRDLLLAQAERAAVLAQLSASETDYVDAVAEYEALAGPPPTRFPAETPTIGFALDQHPAVRAALARAAAAQARATTQSYGSRPRIEGRVGARRERDGAGNGYGNALLAGIGIPIGQNYIAIAETAGARSEAARATAEAALVRRRLAAERAAAERRLALSRRALGEARIRQDALSQALALTERGRREGEVGYIEALRARQALGDATRDLVIAQVEASAAISTFNQAQGVLP